MNIIHGLSRHRARAGLSTGREEMKITFRKKIITKIF